MMIRTLLFTIVILLVNPFISHADSIVYDALPVKAKAGDGITVLLQRYKLIENSDNLKRFYELNGLNKSSLLIKDKSYKLPITVYKYDQKSIRSTIGQNNWEKAIRIKEYNEWLQSKGLRQTHFTDSKLLWVPYHELSDSPVKIDTEPEIIAKSKTPSPKKSNAKHTNKLFGKAYEEVELIDNSLKGRVYYLVSGHGGIDPGAVCTECEAELCEDEYAYDVTLRLARQLMMHGATIEIVVQDPNDGIRDGEYLACDNGEVLANGESLRTRKQLVRLNRRAGYVNSMYRKHQKAGVKEQLLVSIHVDSRTDNKRQDVFFNYNPISNSSKKLATDLMQTFEEKYNHYQKGRNYRGYINGRNLHVLRVTQPKAVLIELANIKNKSDHKRILLASNREALAKWIFEGITKRVINHKLDQVVASS
jgi:N-acetylmuramoyl-L-alanine amidase